MDTAALAPRISAAKAALAIAEAGLGAAIRELQIAPRAEKTTIGPRLDEAFGRIRVANRELAELEALVLALPGSRVAGSA